MKGVGKVVTYTGMLYYEKDGVEDLVTFTAAKKLNALIKVRVLANGFVMIVMKLIIIIVYQERAFSC